MPPKKVPSTPGEGPAPVAAGSSQSSSSGAALSSSRRSSAYDGNFESHMDDFKILAVARSSRPSNLVEVVAALRAPREEARDAVTEDDFARLQAAYDRAFDEDDVVTIILPLVVGPSDWFEHNSSRNVLCNNLTPLTNNTIVSIKPNVYYGAPSSQFAPDVRATLAAHIIPTAAAPRPLLPNFFVEIKGPSGTEIVALRQVRYDGAVGARAMHSLQNYAAVRDGLPRSAHVYDGRVRALSVTLFSDRLRIFGHHITAPAPGESRPTYHMTRLGGWLLTEEFDQFRQGVYAYRNARDLARRFRDELIAEANNVARISGVGMATEEANEAATVFPDTTGQTGQTDQTDQTDQTNSQPSMAPPAEPASRVASKRPLDFTTADANDSGPASKTNRSSHRTNATDANNETE
ncbi:hypothetical protein Sste5346_007094 [Sporothrix stenoceras]|uniref:DUF7924 domain-containing protein n=1 Tax=Sporothrix stenoceras TaxID=5173 RepID=A0ABR3YVF6_9PEZI